MRNTTPALLSKLVLAAFLSLAAFCSSLNADEIDVSFEDIVVSGHGIELANLGRNLQASFFMTYEKPGMFNLWGGSWKTYALLPLEIDGRVRESCAIEGMPLKMDDGTIYLACAGGVSLLPA